MALGISTGTTQCFRVEAQDFNPDNLTVPTEIGRHYRVAPH